MPGSGIDTDGIQSALDLFKSGLDILKSARSMLPDGKKSSQLLAQIETAERQLHLAEAQIAKSLGYPICRCNFPPSVMLKVRTDIDTNIKIFQCLLCGDENPDGQTLKRKQVLNSPISSGEKFSRLLNKRD